MRTVDRSGQSAFAQLRTFVHLLISREMTSLISTSFFVFLLAACSGPASTDVDDAQPLMIAVKYGQEHYPPKTFDPNIVGIEHVVHDAGAFWDVEFWPIDSATGGGLQVRIRKSDKIVIYAGRTQ